MGLGLGLGEGLGLGLGSGLVARVEGKDWGSEKG